MSKYTISIKDIVYAYNQNNPNQNQTIYQKIEYARPKISFLILIIIFIT